MKSLRWIIATLLISYAAEILAAAEDDANDGKSIDEILMSAASRNSVEMLDLFHMMEENKMMAMVELDILLNMTELARYKTNPSRNKRKALRYGPSRWPMCKVPYEITESEFTGRDIEMIKAAVKDWETYTCLEFKQVQSSDANRYPDRIVFKNGDGCYSRLGRVGGPQPIALARGCRTRGIVVHEIGHAIGWIHEQARPDRDEYITINYAQIPVNWHPQYNKVASRYINDFNVVYDYTSIMHYSGRAFGEGTIITKNPTYQNKIGQRDGLSFRDIKLANLMYDCAAMNKCTEEKQCPGEGYVGKGCKCYCPGSPGKPIEECSITTTTTTTRQPVITTTRRPVITTQPPTRVCRDVITTCSTFKQDGQCQRDKARMALYCKLTCELCDEDLNKMCMDFDDACPTFAAAGYCNVTGTSEFVKVECPKSCKLCEPQLACSQSDFFNSGSIPDLNKLLIFLVVTLIKF
ncbi:zinc metalloproteinase nas-13 [Patella vulgata]|uniref:zinc metalloproteinase nas-13 n=1 Tax=Patella vulgata TaxID=6465 RepID=UPI00217FEA22|nr:zinc metalloproteinase nas-13 [Patella vulgata]